MWGERALANDMRRQELRGDERSWYPQKAMPRRFDAPIPIWRSFGPKLGWAKPVPYEPMGEEFAVRSYFEERAHQSEDMAMLAGLCDTRPDVWDKLWVEWGESIEAEQVIEHIINVEYTALLAVDMSSDALTVDDFFQMYNNPAFMEELAGLYQQLREITANGGKGSKAFFARLDEWLLGHGGRSYPGLRRETVGKSLAYPKSKPPCWHGRDHADFKHPGRPWKVERRAATWGTYIIAWIVGSETLAVRLWNLLPLPAGYLWGEPLGYGLKKYIDAKRRLVKDLRETGLLQGRNQLKPYHPLRRDMADYMEAILAKVETEEALAKVGTVIAESFPVPA